MQHECRPDGTVIVRCAFKSAPDEVRKTLGFIEQSLTDHGNATQLESPWQLVIAEVLNNVVEHAYQDRPDGDIRVQIEFFETRLRAVIVDQGRSMPQGALPQGKQANLDVDVQDLPEGGFGWFLIHSLTDELVYQRTDGANHLLLELPYAATP